MKCSLLHSLCLCCFAGCLFNLSPAGRAEDLKVLPEKLGPTSPTAMMHSYWLRVAREAFDRHDAEYANLKTPEQLAAYQKRMREFFVAQLGGFPERTPLNPQVTGRIEREGYHIEKIIFESQPKHYVTALLYLPNAKPPYPGVLVPCGHSAEGKAMETYQLICTLLVNNRMAVLCYDPIDQGERMQLLDEKGKARISSTEAHSQIGVGSILLGRNTATFRIWDGMRAIDYLQSRPEVDPKRIGCTGNSGGGTLTSYLMALDDRIQCAAPCCYLTDLRRVTEKIGPQDAEQDIYGQIAYGMDHAEYVIMRAPKPTLMGLATKDYFDIGGARETFRKAKACYALLGFAERMEKVETEREHGFTPQLRAGAARWMWRWLLKEEGAFNEVEPPALKVSELCCATSMQVMLMPGARNVYDLNRDLDEKLADARKEFWRANGKEKALAEVRRITGIRKLADLPEPQCEKVGTIPRNGYRIEKLILRPEAGIWLPALAFIPAQPNGEATLYLHEAGKQEDAAPGGAIESLVAKGQAVLAVDLRGIGETQSGGKPSRLGREWREIFMAYLLGTSYPAKRAEDILVCARYLMKSEDAKKPQKLHLVSVGLVGPAALHAAALEPQLFSSLTLRRCIASWSNVVRTPMSDNQLINVVHGALRVYDLPDLLSTLPREMVAISDPLDAAGKPFPGSAGVPAR
ncbi:MAG: acetylxylan esterase [Candidatus Sumerlaeota bacterium]|nr:acetylxylan esterase [Candidatus Sumerlaeota bacterium]